MAPDCDIRGSGAHLDAILETHHFNCSGRGRHSGNCTPKVSVTPERRGCGLLPPHEFRMLRMAVQPSLSDHLPPSAEAQPKAASLHLAGISLLRRVTIWLSAYMTIFLLPIMPADADPIRKLGESVLVKRVVDPAPPGEKSGILGAVPIFITNAIEIPNMDRLFRRISRAQSSNEGGARDSIGIVPVTINISEKMIELSYAEAMPNIYPTTAFAGYVFEFYDASAGDLSDVCLDKDLRLSGQKDSSVSASKNIVSVNLAGLPYEPQSHIVIHFRCPPVVISSLYPD